MKKRIQSPEIRLSFCLCPHKFSFFQKTALGEAQFIYSLGDLPHRKGYMAWIAEKAYIILALSNKPAKLARFQISI